MPVNEEKIALIVEAVNKFKDTFNDLNTALKQAEAGGKAAFQKMEGAAKTWTDFVKEKMGPAMKAAMADGLSHSEAHTKAIRQIAAEWKTYKSSGVEAVAAVGAQHAHTGQQGESVLQKLRANWLAVTVAITAAGVAIAEALEYMNKGAKAQQAEESFRSVAAAANESADEILAAMKRASNGTVDESDIMQKATKGMMQGLSGSQLVQIMEAARIAARVTGQDIGEAYETITDAIANKLPRSLLQYGLVTKEQMKLLEATMAAGTREVDLFGIAMANSADQAKKLGSVQENNAEKMQKLKALWNDVKENIGSAIWDLIDGIKALALGAVNVVMGMMGGFVTTIFGVVLLAQTAMNKLGIVSDATLTKTREDFEKVKEATKDYFSKAFGGKPKPMDKPEMKPGSSSSRAGSAGEIEAQMRAVLALKAREAELAAQISDLDIAEKTRAVSHLAAMQGRVDLTKELLDVQQKNLAQIDKEKNPQAWAAQQKAIDDTRKKLIEFRLALRELAGIFGEGFTEGLTRYVESIGSAFQQAVQLAQETAHAMQQAFSDFFFDIMTNKLKHYSDYVKSFLESIARALANTMAQNAAAGIATGVAKWFAGGTGNDPNGVETEYHHQGGTVLHKGGYIPRFHFGGLMADERPAILQTGEGVLSRRGMAALDELNNGAGGGGTNVTVEIVNKSSQAVKGSQGPTRFDLRGMVVSVILEDLDGNGPLRQAGVGGK